MKGFADRTGNIVWIDLETTGLDEKECHILELAMIITNKELERVCEDMVLVINQGKEELDSLNDFCRHMHTKNRLLKEVEYSDITLKRAEELVYERIKKYTQRGKVPLGGSSVHFDRKFLAKHMPTVCGHLSHRNIDVSSLQELFYRWYPPKILRSCLTYSDRHRAHGDIIKSVESLKAYRKTFLKKREVVEREYV